MLADYFRHGRAPTVDVGQGTVLALEDVEAQKLPLLCCRRVRDGQRISASAKTSNRARQEAADLRVCLGVQAIGEYFGGPARPVGRPAQAGRRRSGPGGC
jgi:anthranilate/para-aminobenzoate synthase component II